MHCVFYHEYFTMLWVVFLELFILLHDFVFFWGLECLLLRCMRLNCLLFLWKFLIVFACGFRRRLKFGISFPICVIACGLKLFCQEDNFFISFLTFNFSHFCWVNFALDFSHGCLYYFFRTCMKLGTSKLFDREASMDCRLSIDMKWNVCIIV